VSHRDTLLCFISTDTGGIYRVPRVSPGVTASKLFPPLLVAGYTGPSSSLQTTPECPVLILLSGVQSGVLYLLGLISGLRRGGRGIPMSSLVVEMDLLPPRPDCPLWSLVFGECAFLPFSVGPPGDCPWKHYGERAWSSRRFALTTGLKANPLRVVFPSMLYPSRSRN